MPSVLITGANRGLGLEFARQYLADGWQVYAACRNPASASELRHLAENAGGKLQIMAMDVTDAASIHAAAKDLDGQAIDLLLNNAAIIGPRNQTIGNIDYEAWAEAFAVNTMGPMRVSEAFVEHLAKSDLKLIVSLTSGMGSIADNTSGGSIVYRSTKAAMNMVMRSLAVDLAPRGIVCVVVNPGWVRTDMGGPNATQEPSESIGKLRRLIASLGPEQSGKFFNHTGREFPW
jgi:NAD(P)-dependent dehydrogenase (short-subunit alcohol dehydrogenase family)